MSDSGETASSSSEELAYTKGGAAAAPVVRPLHEYELEQASLRHMMAAEGKVQTVQRFAELPSDEDRLRDPAERAAWEVRHAARKARLDEALRRHA